MLNSTDSLKLLNNKEKGSNELFDFVKNLTGSGILYLNDDIVGLWYHSTVSCVKRIYVILLNNKESYPTNNSYGLTLDELLLHNQKIKKLKILSVKDPDNEPIFRSYIHSAVTLPINNNPKDIIRELVEKLAISSKCSLVDYLKMLTLINSTKKSSDNIDDKLEEAKMMLEPYFKRFEENKEVLDELEDKLFIVSVNI